jgi:hypothetical protein
MKYISNSMDGTDDDILGAEGNTDNSTKYEEYGH